MERKPACRPLLPFEKLFTRSKVLLSRPSIPLSKDDCIRSAETTRPMHRKNNEAVQRVEETEKERECVYVCVYEREEGETSPLLLLLPSPR